MRLVIVFTTLIIFTCLACDLTYGPIDLLAKNSARDLVDRQIKTIAIAPFNSMNGKYQNMSSILREKYKAKLSTRAEFFNISDRTEVQTLLAEQDLRESGMFREETITKLGSMYSINGVVTGKFIVTENWLGNPKKVTLFITNISLASGVSKSFEATEIPL
ncbi:MAG: hypothetical protein ACRBG0_17725 [Lewinella sp.]|uniref:hypothetical protein n=1 Tax=Lewinella sp. TaxID=2004506 RepID=UPI003D6B4AC4